MHEAHITLEHLKEYFTKDAFAELCGIEIIETGPGSARLRLAVDKRHLNGLGMVHGGVLFTLADMAFTAAVHSRGKSAVAINATISFMKAGRTGVLFAEAREVSRNRKLGTYTVHITDGSGEVLCLFQGTAYIKVESFLHTPG
ncbi:MAG TPA: PaaI family thioesterase [Deltaproteobacteria bacterium]|nr:PaaI family thioesterase [Deltaproteobacteria bacterium]HPR54789.1 PaaI family thioesterase [Deltaproteobacteria bacterium]